MLANDSVQATPAGSRSGPPASTGIVTPLRDASATVLILFSLTLLNSLRGADTPRLADLPGNFHVVEPGRVYRCRQPDAAELDRLFQQLGVRTVLNLRGRNEGQDWYDDEVRMCQARGVRFIEHAMNSKKLPAPDMLVGIMRDLERATYPVLIHCNAGADRTGAISAAYRVLLLGDSSGTAIDELSPESLHFRSLAPCMDKLVEVISQSPQWLADYTTASTQPCEN